MKPTRKRKEKLVEAAFDEVMAEAKSAIGWQRCEQAEALLEQLGAKDWVRMRDNLTRARRTLNDAFHIFDDVAKLTWENYVAGKGKGKPWSKTPPKVMEQRKQERQQHSERFGMAFHLRTLTNNNRVDEDEPPFAVVFKLEEGNGVPNLWFMRCSSCHTPLMMMWDRTHHYFAGCCVGCWNIQKIEDHPEHP